MNVGIIGSGGREHAICVSLKESSKVEKIYCFPGNAGTSETAENVLLNLENFNDLKEFIIYYCNSISVLPYNIGNLINLEIFKNF